MDRYRTKAGVVSTPQTVRATQWHGEPMRMMLQQPTGQVVWVHVNPLDWIIYAANGACGQLSDELFCASYVLELHVP